MVNAERSGNSVEMGAFAAQKHEPNGTIDSSVCSKMLQLGSPIYKLTIQIEKIRPKPCPRSKKFGFQSADKREEEKAPNEEEEEEEEEVERVTSSLAIVSTEEKSDLSRKQAICLICNVTFQSAQSLYLHKKKHHRFVCQICDAYCSTQGLCDKHEKLHLSNDPKLPHKCHLCSQKFDSKRNVRLHTRVMHGKSSTIQPRENSLRLRSSRAKQIVKSAEKIIDSDCRERTTRRRNETRNSSNYGAVTFTCRVCCKDFSTVEAAEAHTREHLELVDKEHRCNICRKIFKNEMILNAHLAQHLSRALRCPMCPKAFINRATLRTHMKSHNQEK